MYKRFKAVNIIVCIVCILLALTAIIMGIVMAAKPEQGEDIEFVSMDRLPNHFGKNGVYVSKNFFIDRDLQMPEYAIVYYKKSKSNIYGVDGKLILGRGKNRSYEFFSKSIENQDSFDISLQITYISNFKLELNKDFSKEYKGVCYEKSMCDFKENDIKKDGVKYSIKINNDNLESEGGLYLIIAPSNGNNISLPQFEEYCNIIFNSFIDNLVYMDW